MIKVQKIQTPPPNLSDIYPLSLFYYQRYSSRTFKKTYFANASRSLENVSSCCIPKFAIQAITFLSTSNCSSLPRSSHIFPTEWWNDAFKRYEGFYWELDIFYECINKIFILNLPLQEKSAQIGCLGRSMQDCPQNYSENKDRGSPRIHKVFFD